MKTVQLLFILFFIMAVGIFTTPTNDLLEITAQLCQFSQPKEECLCSEEMEETAFFLKMYCRNKE